VTDVHYPDEERGPASHRRPTFPYVFWISLSTLWRAGTLGERLQRAGHNRVIKFHGEFMKKLIAVLLAAVFASMTVTAMAADEMKKDETKMDKKVEKKVTKKKAKKAAKKDEMKKDEMKK
jgi:hypothetical protein